MAHTHPPPVASPGFFDRLLGVFTEVRPGEGTRAAAMLLNIFLILSSYYIMKTVREALILGTDVSAALKSMGVTGSAELKTYAAAGQALMLIGFVPAYSWFASRVDRMKLVLGVTAFFVTNIVLFGLAVQAEVKYIELLFYVWLGLFNMSIVAQFWSYANDIYTKDAGLRLFPVIGVGMTLGSPLGAWIAERMFKSHVPIAGMLYVAAAVLLVSVVLYAAANRGGSGAGHGAAAKEKIGGKGAFSLVLRSRYILFIVVLVVLLNSVNTLGEYILGNLVVARAGELALASSSFDTRAYLGAFYGSYYFWVNVLAVVLQMFAAPRLVKHFGLAGVLFALPIVALGAYGVVLLGATMGIVRWAKTAENATDYSIMNTARQLLWLPTSREEKYKAKQAVDTFFVRLGDLATAFVVFAGTSWLTLGVRGFAALNVVVVLAWLAVAVILVRENRRLSAQRTDEVAAR